MQRRILLALALALAAGCDKSESAPTPGPASGKGPGTGSAPAPAPAGTVTVFVDDKQVATVEPARIAAWPRLETLIPAAAQQLGTWESISIRGKTSQDIASPADKYPTFVPALYPGPDGPSFGMFDVVDLVNKAPAKLAIAGVTEIRIKRLEDSNRGMNEEGGITDFDPKQIDIAIEGGDKPVLAGTAILALPREPPPNGDTNTQGWKLTTLIAAAGIKPQATVLLGDGSGTTLKLGPADLDPAKSVPYLKLNKKGQLRFRVYTKEGDGWTLGGNLKGLSSIKVVR